MQELKLNRCIFMRFRFRELVLKIFILLSVEKTIVTSTNLHREKMILIKK